jgi:hypothetical protein
METMMPTDDRELEQECESWDWARTAGVTSEELREALKSAQGSGSLAPAIAKAA